MTMLGGWNILVVDDDFFTLDIMAKLLTHFGANVLTAEHGKAALERMATQRPDFILTDLSMPELDGWELIALLKGDPATHDIPLIALTAHVMSGDREKAMAAGCDSYLTKPIVPATFLKDLLEALQSIPALAEYFKGE